MGSVRGRNESECNSNLNKKCENKVEPKSTFFQKHPKVQEQMDAIKGRSARSFMIRSTNPSMQKKIIPHIQKSNNNSRRARGICRRSTKW